MKSAPLHITSHPPLFWCRFVVSKSRKISGYPTLQRSAESGVRQTASCGLPALRGAAALRLRPSHGTHRRCRPALPLQARQREGARRCLPGHFDTQTLCFPTSPTCSAARDSTAPCRAAPGRHTMGHRGGEGRRRPHLYTLQSQPAEQLPVQVFTALFRHDFHRTSTPHHQK